jgi:HEAT repeat protein
MVGQSAAWALGRIGAASVPTLVEALSDSRAFVRIRALYALTKIGQLPASAREAMQRAVLDPDRSVSRMASRAVTQLGPRPSRGAGAADLGTEADLGAGLAASDPQARVSAVRRFQPYTADAQSAIPLLVQALGDSEPSVRAAAADALVAFGPSARTALSAALADPSPVVRREASVTLVRLGGPR